MALPPAMSRHIDRWIGTLPSVWWIYLKLRLRGHLAAHASGATVRRLLRETIDTWRSERRASIAPLLARGLSTRQVEQLVPAPGASWNTLIPPRLFAAELLSAKGVEMAMWGLGEKARRPRPAPPGAPTLDEMRGRLRAGMTRDEFFSALDEIVVERGLQISLPSADEGLVGLPVAEGGELLCFLTGGVLRYVEYQGGIFLEMDDPASAPGA